MNEVQAVLGEEMNFHFFQAVCRNIVGPYAMSLVLSKTMYVPVNDLFVVLSIRLSVK